MKQQNWRQVIWREWRHCHDIEYEAHLFKIVADAPTGLSSRLLLILFDATGGAAIALLVGFVFTLRLDILLQLMLTGGLMGLLHGLYRARNLTWRVWLERLQSNTPTASAGQLFFGGLALLLLTGMVFGPLAWLAIVGLFWSFGGLVYWINSATNPAETYRSHDRRWWFWWRERPHLLAVEAALHRACAESPQVAAMWSEPLRRLDRAKNKTAPPETLIRQLLDHHWETRLAAAYRLVLLGPIAAPALEQLAHNDTSPLQNTAHWLLANIAAQPGN
jgi:hypothetical protein